MKNNSAFFLLLIVVLTHLSGCDRQSVIKFAGETQGTTYHVTIAKTTSSLDSVELQQRVEQRLHEIDLALSNYRDDSELSQFNRAPAGEWIELGRDLNNVLKVSQQMSTESDGAFDITVAPLVDLWGFGPHKKSETIPSDVDIASAKRHVDYRHIELDTTQPRARKNQALTIDVNGIAQGYSVDQLADVLSALSCTDFLVEVGGELRLVGHNPQGKLWRIGIEKPTDDLVEVQQPVFASGVGVTTAGDYHDYFEKNGVRYSHTIDPRSGRPIAHTLASVTVIAANAMLADGYDTVLEVLGPEQGFEFARQHHLAAYFIVRTDNAFAVRTTPEMAPYLTEPR